MPTWAGGTTFSRVPFLCFPRVNYMGGFSESWRDEEGGSNYSVTHMCCCRSAEWGLESPSLLLGFSLRCSDSWARCVCVQLWDKDSVSYCSSSIGEPQPIKMSTKSNILETPYRDFLLLVIVG